MGKLEGKIAVVTGGNSGIGLAAAEALVVEGADAFVTGRRKAELDAPVANIGRNVTAVQGDLSRPDDLDRLYIERGSAAGRVIGTAGGKEKCDWLVEEAHFDAAIDYKHEDIGARLSALCPDGIDVFFDNVGGAVLNEVLARIRFRARIVLCGSISKSDTFEPQPGPANYSNLVARRGRMDGFTGIHYAARVPDALEALRRWQREGSIAQREDVAVGLENAPRTLMRLFSGENFGKQLVKIADAPS